MLKSYARERVKSEDGFIMFVVRFRACSLDKPTPFVAYQYKYTYRSEIVENPSFGDIAFVFLLK